MFFPGLLETDHIPTQHNDSFKNAQRSRRLPSEAQRTIGLRTGPGNLFQIPKRRPRAGAAAPDEPTAPPRYPFQTAPPGAGLWGPQCEGCPEPASRRPGRGYSSPAAALMPARWQQPGPPAPSLLGRSPGVPAPPPSRRAVAFARVPVALARALAGSGCGPRCCGAATNPGARPSSGGSARLAARSAQGEPRGPRPLQGGRRSGKPGTRTVPDCPTARVPPGLPDPGQRPPRRTACVS